MTFAAGLDAAAISSFAAGFADSTAGFWGIEFVAGAAGDRIASATLRMPGPGFFDLDGVGNYANQTAPIFDAVSSSGLTAGDVFFTFSGVHPTVINIAFAAGAFAPGDRLQFAADIDGLGSKLGGAVGAYGGTQLTITLEDGRLGSANLTTDTSVASRANLQIDAVPEPGTFLPLLGGIGLCAILASRRKTSRAERSK